MMQQLSAPIQVVKYSEQQDNRDTFLIQKPEAKAPTPDGGSGAQGDRISVFGNALELLSGLDAPKEQPEAAPVQP